MGVMRTCQASESHSLGLRQQAVGFGLVVLACVGICFSLNLQKWVHMCNADPSGKPRTHFMRLPLWWVAVLANTASELVNLAALGFAPATLVTPLGCLTVVFNSMTAVVWLREPFLRRDLLGLLLIFIGVAFVVASQVDSPPASITPEYLEWMVTSSVSFWVYVGSLAVLLLLLVVLVQPRYAATYSWVYLGESSICGSVSTVAARGFASLLGPPLPGDWTNLYTRPGAWCVWGSLAVLLLSATSSLVLQNQAMIHFENSEVVPVYFCLFALGGVMGAAFAFEEVCFPWVLMLLPGLVLCMAGVTVISHRRDKRVAAAQRQDSPAEARADALHPVVAHSASGVEPHGTSASTIASDGPRVSYLDDLPEHPLLGLGGGTLSGTLSTLSSILRRSTQNELRASGSLPIEALLPPSRTGSRSSRHSADPLQPPPLTIANGPTVT